jgi:hypothetical protein
MEREVGRHRDALLADLHGRMVEVGAGNGMNFAHYPSSVRGVVAGEPEPYLRRRAEQAAARAAVAVTVLDGVADALPRAFEHVRSTRAAKARVQDALDRAGVLPRLAGGCHCARDALAAIVDAGFRVADVRRVDVGPSWLVTNRHVLARAVAPR